MTDPLPTSDSTSEATLRHLRRITLHITPLPVDEWIFDRDTHTLYVDEDGDIVPAIREALAALAPRAPELVCLPGDGAGRRPAVRRHLTCVHDSAITPAGR